MNRLDDMYDIRKHKKYRKLRRELLRDYSYFQKFLREGLIGPYKNPLDDDETPICWQGYLYKARKPKKYYFPQSPFGASIGLPFKWSRIKYPTREVYP